MVNRSMRLYTVLLFGITFGFVLSTLLQNLSYPDLSKTAAGWTVDYTSQLDRRKVSFSNLDTKASELDEQIDIGGYYDYERLVLLREEEEENEEGRRRGEGDVVGERVVATETIGGGIENKMKQREYMNNGWQGRNVRESMNGNPVIKLSDELATRRPLLIAVITSVSQLMSQTLAIQGTWAQETSHIIYFTGEVQTLPHLPHGMVVVQLEGLDDKQAGWELKELSVINYISTHYLDNTDWFLIVGDETYVSPVALESELNKYDATMSVYLGRPLEPPTEEQEEEDEKESGVDKLCNSVTGVVYSRGFLEQLKPYLPVCWPGNGGEMRSLSGCISLMGLKCTSAKQVTSQYHFLYECKN